MAQFFYNFKAQKPVIDAKPAGFVGFGTALDPLQVTQQFLPTANGLLDFTTRPGTWTAGDFFSALRFIPLEIGMVADSDVLYKFRLLSYSGGGYSNDGLGVMARVDSYAPSSYSNGYEISISGNGANNSGFARRRVSGNNADLGTFSGIPLRDTAEWVWLRIRVRGASLQVRSWLDSVAEPTTWNWDITDSEVTAPGYLVLGMNGSGPAGRAIEYASIAIGTGVDDAPLSMPRTVAGTLLKPDDSPASGYVVRCYDRATGMLLGETLANVLGAFTFTLQGQVGPVTVLGVDQLGNTWNAAVKDLINPS